MSLMSMTGFGRASTDSERGRVTLEVRSLNHRFLEVTVRSPRDFLYLDPEVRRMVRERCSRGKVEANVTIEGRTAAMEVDLNGVEKTVAALENVAALVNDSVRLDHILAAGDILTQRQEDTEDLERQILDSLSAALDRLVEHRAREGAALQKDIRSRVAELRRVTADMVPLAATVPARALKQIGDTLDRIDMGESVDRQRLEAEAALLAQRADISEEMTRLAVHLDSLEETLTRGGPVGRRIDFILQEIQREVNTIGSKAGITGISPLVVDFKSELEKIREQVQNVE